MGFSELDCLLEKLVKPFSFLVPAASAGENVNLFDTLAKHHFAGEDGKPLDVKALKEKLAGHYTTLSFGFAGCADACPLAVNPSLSTIGKFTDTAPLTSIVINVQPKTEGKSDTIVPNAYAKHLRAMLPQNVIMLYPTDEKGNLSNQAAVKAQQAFYQIPDNKDTVQHSNYILLFAPGGTQLAEKYSSKDTAEQFTDAWKGHIKPENKAARGR